MQLFFQENIQIGSIVLSETTSKHCVQVLRMKEGDCIELCNGMGISAIAKFTLADKKKSIVEVKEIIQHTEKQHKIYLAISFTKNPSRIEWLIEKITEIGITGIIPLQTKRTEKIFLKKERLQNILLSAMLQSKQYFLPTLYDVISLEKCLADFAFVENKFIAHCEENSNKNSLSNLKLENTKSSIVLIGPEGDFTTEEIEYAIQNNFSPISLGETRLRTETAGLVAVTLLNFK